MPLIRRQVARDWEELEKAEVIPELHSAAAANAEVGASTPAGERLAALAWPGLPNRPWPAQLPAQHSP